MFTQNSQGIENYNYGITRSFESRNDIVVVRTRGDMSRDAINTWASVLILTMQEWKSNRPLALLHDLTHPSQGLSPYARERTIDLMNRIPEGMVVYSAVVLPRTFMYRIIEMFLRTPIFNRENHELLVFPSEKLALNWLEEKLTDY